MPSSQRVKPKPNITWTPSKASAQILLVFLFFHLSEFLAHADNVGNLWTRGSNSLLLHN